MNIKNKLIHLSVPGLCIVMNACSIDVPPPDLYSDPDAISNVKAARSLLTSCYLLYPHYEYELSVMGNDFCLTNLSGKDVEQQNLYLWQDNRLSDFATTAWQTYYNCIANCDVLLDRMPGVKAETTEEFSERNAIEAEGKLLKAMAYFDVLRLFSSAYNAQDTLGTVIKTRTGVEMKERSSKKECVRYIKNLLQEAASVDNHPESNGWLSQQAALYMLAEVCLYANEYEQAAQYARQLMDGCRTEYIAASNHDRLWGTSSFGGRIFAFNTNTSFYAFIEYSEEGDYFALNPNISYEDTDCRKAWSVFPKEIAGIIRPLMGKYNKLNKENTSITYINRMRYAGAYLMASEAYARLNRDDEAVQAINIYLTAIGATPLPVSLSGQALIDRILEEEYKEFAGEGINYFILKRTQPETLPRYAAWGVSERASIRRTDYRWTLPIPASEYRYNEAITQNTGWPINR